MTSAVAKIGPSRLLSTDPSCMFSTIHLGKGKGTKTAIKNALLAGYRRFDTASHRRYYQEGLLGTALRTAYKDTDVKREDVFVQTKFVPEQKQDWKKKAHVPYKRFQSVQFQIEQTVEASLRLFRTHLEEDQAPYIDSFLFVMPLRNNENPRNAWKVLERYVPTKLRTLGLSNVDIRALELLYDEAIVKPSIVMNPLNATAHECSSMRKFCRANEITYQIDWSMRGSTDLVGLPAVQALAKVVEVSSPLALLAFVFDLADVAVRPGDDISEVPQGLAKVKNWALANPAQWEEWRMGFRRAKTFAPYTT